jgi:hypothetical protein
MRRLAAAVLMLTLLMVSAGSAAATPAAPPTDSAAPQAPSATPVLAYYYQWFDPSSWERAKTDYPVLGRYSSDDPEVMRQHVRQAKAAGLTGFIVSWKSTETNNRRLRALADVARTEAFTLAVIYQGLDFDRDPLPVQRVATDLRFFRDTFAKDPVFAVLGRPLVVWSGTWEFSHDDLATAVAPVRADMDVLASEKDMEGYTRVADVFRGNAYYWSSIDPTRYPDFGARLREMGDQVHRGGGIWLAPFAPGFDARLVGGTRAVDRRDGVTLREEYAAAVRSAPDVLGLISWNEFSENTHVEPSEQLGDRYLTVLGEVLRTPVPPVPAGTPQDPALAAPGGDSSDGVASDSPVGLYRLLAVAGGALLALGIVSAMRGRRRGRRAPPPDRTRSWWRRRTLVVLTTVVLALGVTATLSAVAVGAGPPPPPAPQTPHYQGRQPAADPSHVVIAAAGDIACAADPEGSASETENSPLRCQAAATADLVSEIEPDAVLTLGDHQYPDGSLARFRASYDLTWGRFAEITHPVVGNHEYGTRGAAGYFDYFGPSAGPREAGYYSYDLGAWHVVALNSECRRVGGCEAGSTQERWLRDDLAAHPASCVLAYWHRPRYSTGHHGDSAETSALWRALQDAGTDIVLSGHDHDYERFAPMNADGAQNPHGIRSFVVGTGGDSFYRLHSPTPGREIAIASAPGVLRLALTPDGYDWAFRTVGADPQGTVADSGTTRCSTT